MAGFCSAHRTYNQNCIACAMAWNGRGMRQIIDRLLDDKDAEIAALRAEVERLKEERRWILVGERMPEIAEDEFLSEPVLVSSFDPKWPKADSNRVQEASWYKDKGSDDDEEVAGCWSAASNAYSGGYERLRHVTHWMPLPARPEVKE